MATRTRPISSSSSAVKTLRGAKIDTKTDMWSSLLDSVASVKRIPEKRIMLLGGSPTTQKDFLEMLASRSQKKLPERQRQIPPIANDFALGYTYQEVLDTDQEDILARLSIYTLQNSSIGFADLLKPLLTPATIPETLLVLLLDWSEPWNWIIQIRDWMRLLHAALSSISEEAKVTMQEIMQEWEQQKRGGAYDMGLANAPAEANVTIPLGSGEWDEALGLPLCVVCHNAEQIDILEREHGWREDNFDYVLQFIRTILLKHGASLIYTSSSIPNSAPLLIQYSLGIRSILKREPLKHNVIDREKILIPPNWDSWGKIKVLREGFDIEGTSQKWSLEIQPPQAVIPSSENPTEATESSDLVNSWNSNIKNPNTLTTVLPSSKSESGLEPRTLSIQEFLTGQIPTVERLKAEEEALAAKEAKSGNQTPDMIDESSRVKEHVGPIQFNVGGINLDAEDMLNHIKERGIARASSPDKNSAPGSEKLASPVGEDSTKSQQNPEQLKAFFANLIKKGGTSSNPGTPPRLGAKGPSQS